MTTILPSLRGQKPYTKSLVVILPARIETTINFYILPVATATYEFSTIKRKKLIPKIDVPNTIIMLAFIRDNKICFRGFKTSASALKNSLTMKLILEDMNTINLKLSSGKIESENTISFSKIQTCGGKVEEQLNTSIRIIGEHINFLNKIYEKCIKNIDITIAIVEWLLSIVCGPFDILYYPKFYNRDCIPGVTTAAERFIVENNAPAHIDKEILTIFLNTLSTRADELLPNSTAYRNIVNMILDKMKRSYKEIYLTFVPNLKSLEEQIIQHYNTKIQKYKELNGMIDITEYLQFPIDNSQELMYKLACKKIIFNSRCIEDVPHNCLFISNEFIRRNNIIMEGSFSYVVKSLENLAEEIKTNPEAFKKDTSNVYWKAMVNYNIKIGFNIYRQALLDIFAKDVYKNLGYSVNYNKKQIKKLYTIPSYEVGLRVYAVGKEPRTTISINANGTIGLSGPNERECENVFEDFVNIIENHRNEVDAKNFEYDETAVEAVPEGISLDIINSVMNLSLDSNSNQIELVNNHINNSFKTGIVSF